MPRRRHTTAVFVVATTLLALAFTSARVRGQQDPASADAACGELTIRVWDGYAPYIFRDAAGNWRGIEVEMARALAKEAGYRPRLVAIPWNRAMRQLERGELDIVLTLSKTPERERFTHFFAPSTHEQIVVVTRPELVSRFERVRTLDDLVAVGRIGINQEVDYGDDFRKKWNRNPAFRARFEAVTEPRLNIVKLRRGRLAGLLRDKLSVAYSIRHGGEYAGLRYVELPCFPRRPVYFGISKRIAPGKVEALRRAYTALRERGVFDEILQRWTRE
ncbi:MAG: hypothetical protein D6776_09565 [Planctomycetota bacterium]|nr:MAG: hypothetical protein D6776_09565 [Planctomycetota bacterium]